MDDKDLKCECNIENSEINIEKKEEIGIINYLLINQYL